MDDQTATVPLLTGLGLGNAHLTHITSGQKIKNQHAVLFARDGQFGGQPSALQQGACTPSDTIILLVVSVLLHCPERVCARVSVYLCVCVPNESSMPLLL